MRGEIKVVTTSYYTFIYQIKDNVDLPLTLLDFMAEGPSSLAYLISRTKDKEIYIHNYNHEHLIKHIYS